MQLISTWKPRKRCLLRSKKEYETGTLRTMETSTDKWKAKVAGFFPLLQQLRRIRNRDAAETALSRPSAMDLPEHDLNDVFLHCDVATRCRLRRVCRYWKHLVCRPAISEIVMVRENCLMLATPCQQCISLGLRRRRFNHRFHGASRIEPGYYYYATGYHDNRGTTHHWDRRRYYRANGLDGEPPSINLVGHKRHGILGDHVRVLIYDNGRGRGQYGQPLLEMIRSIALYCMNLQQVVLWRTGFEAMLDYFDCSLWTPRCGQPYTVDVAVTRVASYQFLCRVNRSIEDLSSGRTGYIREYSRLERRVDSEQETEWSVRRGRNADQKLLMWIAKYAPGLPDGFHRWPLSGITLSSSSNPRGVSQFRYFPSIDLRQLASYTGMDYDSAQVLGSCITYHGMPDVDCPPASLVTRLCGEAVWPD